MPNVSKLSLNGTVYDINDSVSRQYLSNFRKRVAKSATYTVTANSTIDGDLDFSDELDGYSYDGVSEVYTNAGNGAILCGFSYYNGHVHATYRALTNLTATVTIVANFIKDYE